MMKTKFLYKFKNAISEGKILSIFKNDFSVNDYCCKTKISISKAIGCLKCQSVSSNSSKTPRYKDLKLEVFF